MLKIKHLKSAGVKIPPDEKVIWRYFDLIKFFDLINRNQLYLCRMDLFEDELEGKIPIKDLNEKYPDHKLARINKGTDFSRKDQFASCWTMHPDESYMHWKVFSEKEYGIAIKSTVEKFQLSIKKKDKYDVGYGEVEYINPSNSYLFKRSLYQLYFQKRKPFEFEKEVRILSQLPIG